MSAGRNARRPRTTLTRRALLAGGVGAAAYTVFPGYTGSEKLTINRQTLHLPKWDADGFRVVQVSDIHANTAKQAARAKEAMRWAVAEKPDLIAFTGDFLDYATEEACGHVRDALDELHDANCPCYCVLGNHDWLCTDYKRLQTGVKKSRLKILYNKRVEVSGVTLVGIDDAIARHNNPHHVNWKGTSKSLLVMFHEPDYVGTIPKSASLMLSGHSHGGEVCLPFSLPLRLPAGAIHYHTGYYPHADVPLFVSRGVATCAPFRLFCPPEINVLTLYGQSV
jgi:predicted MPP superfamily phosphohydrolase